MKYSPSLLPSQTLASFIYQTRSLACCNVLSSLGNQSHPQLTIAKSWMVTSSSTSYQLPASAPSMRCRHCIHTVPGEAMQTATRLDVVWDTYISDSLKEYTREKRGKGVRRKVSGKTKLSGNWMDFLRDPLNKKELFAFLTSKVEELKLPPAKAAYVTSGQAVVSIGASTPMKNCNHEEADTRVVVHIVHALEQEAKTIQVRTVDTDVVVILAGTFRDLIATHP